MPRLQGRPCAGRGSDPGRRKRAGRPRPTGWIRTQSRATGRHPRRHSGDDPRADHQPGVRVRACRRSPAVRNRSCSARSEVVLAGGIESMSRMPYLVDAEDARWGHRMGNFTLVDAMYRDGFTCSVCGMIMGETAELLARDYGITREESDAYALETPAPGRTGHQLPDDSATRSCPCRSRTPRASRRRSTRTNIRGLARRSRGFASCRSSSVTSKERPGIITAGSSSGITDGGAAVVLMTAERAKRDDVTPLARILGWASAGVDPRRMGIGPVPAVRKLLDADGAASRRLRSHRVERSVRRAGAGGAARSADAYGPAQRQRRCDRARPSRSAALAPASSSRCCTR